MIGQFDEQMECEMLAEYMDIYIQLVFAIKKSPNSSRVSDIPSFQHYKKNRDDPRYSMRINSYNEKRRLNGVKIEQSHATGLAKEPNTIADRSFNYWQGIRYYTDGNINGDWNVSTNHAVTFVKNTLAAKI